MSVRYEEDFYGWAMANALLLKEGKINQADLEHISEELETLGRSERREFISRLSQVIMHLLKWQFQPNLQSKSWQVTLREQRRRVRRVLKENPSLQAKVEECMLEAYEDALDDAIKETGLDEKIFPNNCPYTFEVCLNDSFFPSSK